MREIKFRAWENRPDDVNCPGSMSYDQKFCHAMIRHPDGLIIMQYTGLKDKNGVEIYEGDIVRMNYGIPPLIEVLVIEYADDEEVFDGLSVSGWWMRNKDKDRLSASLCKIYTPDIEVIGNIHENPELLTPTKG